MNLYPSAAALPSLCGDSTRRQAKSSLIWLSASLCFLLFIISSSFGLCWFSRHDCLRLLMSTSGLGFFKLGTGVVAGMCAVRDKLVVAGMICVISSSSLVSLPCWFSLDSRVFELDGGKFSAIFLDRDSIDSWMVGLWRVLESRFPFRLFGVGVNELCASCGVSILFVVLRLLLLVFEFKLFVVSSFDTGMFVSVRGLRRNWNWRSSVGIILESLLNTGLGGSVMGLGAVRL